MKRTLKTRSQIEYEFYLKTKKGTEGTTLIFHLDHDIMCLVPNMTKKLGTTIKGVIASDNKNFIDMNTGYSYDLRLFISRRSEPSENLEEENNRQVSLNPD